MTQLKRKRSILIRIYCIDYSIGQVFARGLDGVAFEDYTWQEELQEFTSYFTAPVYDGQMLFGVLVIETPFSHLDAILTKRAGLGETGEMYLVGDDGFMRSNSRFVEEPTILQQEVDTEATRGITFLYIYLVNRRKNQQILAETLEESKA